MSRPSFRSVLGEKNFFRLWIGQVISSIGDRFYQFALLSVVLGVESGVGGHVGKESARVVFFGMLPGFLFAPALGWAVDNFERRGLMIFTDLSRAVIALLFLYVWLVLKNLPLVFALVFVMGAMNGLFIPARQAVLPQIVRPSQLVTANALIALVGVIASLIGALLAGLIVSIFPPWSSFLVTSFGFLMSGWFIFQIDKPLPPDHAYADHRLQKTWHEISAGWRELHGHPELMSLIWLNAVFAFSSGVFLITVLEYVITAVNLGLAERLIGVLTEIFAKFAPKPPVFKIHELSLGLLMAMVGLGLGLGVAFCGKSKRWSHWKGLPFFALCLLGIGMIGFAHFKNYGPALIGCVGLGFLGSVIAIPIDARLQQGIGDRHRGRVFAFRNLWTTVSFLAALGINLNGKLLQDIGASRMIQILGVTVTGFGLLLAVLNREQFKAFWAPPTPPASSPDRH